MKSTGATEHPLLSAHFSGPPHCTQWQLSRWRAYIPPQLGPGQWVMPLIIVQKQCKLVNNNWKRGWRIIYRTGVIKGTYQGDLIIDFIKKLYVCKEAHRIKSYSCQKVHLWNGNWYIARWSGVDPIKVTVFVCALLKYKPLEIISATCKHGLDRCVIWHFGRC